MKKSHIDWCPMIPDHWEEKRINQFISNLFSNYNICFRSNNNSIYIF